MSEQQTYECFCGKNYKSKMSVYGHLRLKHSRIFHLNDASAFVLIISGGKKVFKLQKGACIVQRPEGRQSFSVKQEQEIQNKMVQQNKQISAKRSSNQEISQSKIPKLIKQTFKQTKQVKSKSLFDCIKEQQDEERKDDKNKKNQPQSFQKVSTIFRFQEFQEKKSIREALNEYLEVMKSMDKENYLDGKMVVFLLQKCININHEKMQNSESKTSLIPYCQNHEPKYISRIYNYFICDFLPQILSKKQTPLSNLLRHNKILKKKELINFLWGLHEWLQYKRYTSQSLKIDQQHRKTFLNE